MIYIFSNHYKISLLFYLILFCISWPVDNSHGSVYMILSYSGSLVGPLLLILVIC